MSAPRNPNTAALEALIEAHAIELKLPTVRRRFRQLAAEALREQQTPIAYLAALLEAEMAERAERREKRRLIDARFPQIKRLEDFRFQERLSHKPNGLYEFDNGCSCRPRDSGSGGQSPSSAADEKAHRRIGILSQTHKKVRPAMVCATASGQPQGPASHDRRLGGGIVDR